jgi:hypothetical protein
LNDAKTTPQSAGFVPVLKEVTGHALNDEVFAPHGHQGITLIRPLIFWRSLAYG